jgi:polysaccharide deacetylase 2 family uncharacterized protein YibQ
VEVKIGIQSIPRELVIDTDASAEEVEKALTAALGAADSGAASSGDGTAAGPAVFSLTTQKGGRVLVPADKIAFVEFGGDTSRRLGFGPKPAGTTPRD